MTDGRYPCQGSRVYNDVITANCFNMKYFVVVLHFYQPPTQDLAITKKILDSCYLPLLRMLNQQKNFGITVNLSGSLVEQLTALHADEFFRLVKKLVTDGKVELANSLMYHSLLPLTPDKVRQRSILQNRHVVELATGCQVGTGFFPPELAVDQTSLETLSAANQKLPQFSYTIVSENALPTSTKPLGPIVIFQQLPLLVGHQLLIQLFRAFPGQLTTAHVLKFLATKFPTEKLFILPSDAELFGHHYADRWQLLQELLANPELKFLKASDALTQFGESKNATEIPRVTTIQSSSWQDSGDLALWTSMPLQQKYLALARQATELTAYSTDPHVWKRLDQGWSSCYLYWLSNWPWWHPDMVESGATSLIKSVRSVTTLTNSQKRAAEKQYFSLLTEIWEYHWSEQVTQQYGKFDLERAKMVTELVNF